MSETHPVQDLLPGYALGILDEQEKRLVRDHLGSCASCRGELASLREVTGALAASLPAAEPPASLENRIMRAVAAAPKRGVRPVRARPVRARRGDPWRALTAIAASAAVVLAAGNLLQWTGVLSAAHGTSGKLATAVLVGTGDARDAYGTIVLDPKDNEGVLAVTGLPGLDARHQYQLWLIRDGQLRSAGVFSPDADGYGSMLLIVPKDFRDFRAFVVSIEPLGGSAVQTGAAILSGAL